jgi:hypothetical protein
MYFPRQIFGEKKGRNIKFLIKIRPAGAELFHADRQDEANSGFSQFLQKATRKTEIRPF